MFIVIQVSFLEQNKQN